MKNYISILILIICIFCIQFNNSQNLSPKENELAIEILKNCYGIDPASVTNPCDGAAYNYTFSCTTGPTNSQVISTITINPSPFNCQIGNITLFSKVQTIIILGDHVLNIEFFSTWTSLLSLNRLDINIANTAFPTGTIPSSLSRLTIGTLCVPLGKNFFEGGISILTVNQVVSGGSLPIALDTPNNVMTQVTLPVNQYSIPPSNIGEFLVYIYQFILKVQNEKSVPGYQEYSFPTFKGFKKVNFFNIQFINNQVKSTAQIWEAPSNMGFNTMGLTISGMGFNMPVGGIINATENIVPFKFIIDRTCGLVTGCPNNECFLLPVNSTVEFYNCIVPSPTPSSQSTSTTSNGSGSSIENQGGGPSSASILNYSMFLLILSIITSCLI